MIPISVVVSAYNTSVDILREAVESILSQSFTEFEFIIVDDGSTLIETISYLDSLEDTRIRLIRNEASIGVTKSLNIGLKAAIGKYIARMDSDDISLPNRLEKQFIFMESNPDVILCGSTVECFGDQNWLWEVDTSDQETYRISLMFGNSGPAHPSVMFRRSMLEEHHLVYDERIRYAQDYMMWVKASRVGVIHSMDEVLLRYRFHKGQVGYREAEEQQRCDILVIKEQLATLIGNLEEEDVRKHKKLVTDRNISDEAMQWFKKLSEINREKRIYDPAKFDQYVYGMIAKKVCFTYDLSWKNPGSYRKLLEYLPATYVIGEVRRKTVGKRKESKNRK